MEQTKEELERSLELQNEELDYFMLIKEGLDGSDTVDDQLQAHCMGLMIDSKSKLIDAAAEGNPFIAAYFCQTPEIWTAMDLPYYMIMETPLMNAAGPRIPNDVDACVAMGLGSDVCTAIRLAIYYVEEGLVPRPNCCVNLLLPCDGAPMLSQVVDHNKGWADVPKFGSDPPYGDEERDIDYYTEQTKKMLRFVEEHTGVKCDMDRLKEVCEESNNQYRLWAEYNELRRAVPSPHGWGIGGPQCFGIAKYMAPGMPGGTRWFEKLIEVAEHRVANGISSDDVEEEKIRVFWFDVAPLTWVFELFPWMEEEFGAVIVMNMFGNYVYSLIDTSSEESMFRGLAKRNLCDEPMMRQARGVADNFVNDIRRIVKDFKIDCVVWPGHMGHKDGSASMKLMREVCRELDVPYLHLGLDLFDKRYTSVEEIKDKMARFFRAMGLV